MGARVNVLLHGALVLAGTLVLSGCATREELAQQNPDETFDTSAKVVEIRDCIVHPGSNYYYAEPLGDGWQVSYRRGPFADFTVGLLPTPQGTHVEVRLSKKLAGGHGFDDLVKPCLDKAPRL